MGIAWLWGYDRDIHRGEKFVLIVCNGWWESCRPGGGNKGRREVALSPGDRQNQEAFTIKMRFINAGNTFRAGGCLIRLFGPCALLWSAGVAALPMDLSGSVGYSYRSLNTDLSDSTSNQLLGMLRASSYIWQPWFATAEGGVILAMDNSDLSDTYNGTHSATTSSKILSGDAVLNVLPQSRAPFRLSYQATDSRVDNTTVDNPLIKLSGEDFKTTSLDVRQSYITEEGHRIQARYGARTWESDVNGTYEDKVAGLELDYRPAGQRLLARANVENIDQSRTDRHQNNTLVDVNHYYYPTEDLRVDSTASLYNLDTTFNGTTGLVDTTVTDIAQASSFIFWRPVDQRWTVSGGVRALDMKGNDTAQSSDQRSLSASAGAFYQYTQRLRFDGSASITSADVGGAAEGTSQQRLGALYESDLVEIRGYTYQWFASGSVGNQTAPDQSQQSVALSLGHDAQKMWWTGEGSTLRLSINQSLNENLQAGGADASHRLDHSATLGWNQSAFNGTSLLQLTLADSRDLGGQGDAQQLVNFQASRMQNISRLSSLSGNLTLQTVRRDFSGQSNNGTVTSATGQINYQHMRIFGVPQLQFQSDLRLSQASTSEGANRDEWENRLDYSIGMVDTSLSYRILDDGVNNSRLLYFRIMRRF